MGVENKKYYLCYYLGFVFLRWEEFERKFGIGIYIRFWGFCFGCCGSMWVCVKVFVKVRVWDKVMLYGSKENSRKCKMRLFMEDWL